MKLFLLLVALLVIALGIPVGYFYYSSRTPDSISEGEVILSRDDDESLTVVVDCEGDPGGCALLYRAYKLDSGPISCTLASQIPPPPVVSLDAKMKDETFGISFGRVCDHGDLGDVSRSFIKKHAPELFTLRSRVPYEQ